MGTDLKKIIKISSDKSSQINENNYKDTLAAQIAKTDLILGVGENTQKSEQSQQLINKKINIDLVERFLITLPRKELDNVQYLIDKYLSLGKHVTKSEILRLVILLVTRLLDNEKISSMDLVPKLKVGRKKNKHV